MFVYGLAVSGRGQGQTRLLELSRLLFQEATGRSYSASRKWEKRIGFREAIPALIGMFVFLRYPRALGD